MTGVRLPTGIGFFSSPRRTEPTHPHTEWVPGALTPAIKRPTREPDHLPHPVPKLRLLLHGRRYVFMARYLVKNRDNFTRNFTVSQSSCSRLSLRIRDPTEHFNKTLYKSHTIGINPIYFNIYRR